MTSQIVMVLKRFIVDELRQPTLSVKLLQLTSQKCQVGRDGGGTVDFVSQWSSGDAMSDRNMAIWVCLNKNFSDVLFVALIVAAPLKMMRGAQCSLHISGDF